MKYVSTRGEVAAVNFKDAVMMGLADDGGLLVPETIPDLSAHMAQWRDLSFTDLAKALLPHFVDDIPADELDVLIDDAYATFAIDQVVRMETVGHVQVLELFHGPTLAFKDVALQLLGQLFDHILAERGAHLNIVGATSGDTGSAAIAGVRGRDNIDIFVMYPLGRVSDLQEAQMTTVADDNVHCLAIEGSFDDCQKILKDLFGDLSLKRQLHLGAVNSVNFARVLAQIVYYGYASLQVEGAANFCVPTGNFGNVFAGYLAKRLGFPINKLIVATNANDILARFFNTGEYSRGNVQFTHTPAMDIQVASNFERYLYYYLDQDAAKVREFMGDFRDTGKATLSALPDDGIIQSVSVSNEATEASIARVYDETGYVADPHTAVGLAAAQQFKDLQPLICVATANPAKFPEVVSLATGQHPRHPSLDALVDLPTKRTILPADEAAVREYLRAHAR